MVELLFSLISDIWYVLYIYMMCGIWPIMKCDIDVWYRTYDTMIRDIWYIYNMVHHLKCVHTIHKIYWYIHIHYIYICIINIHIHKHLDTLHTPKNISKLLFFCFALPRQREILLMAEILHHPPGMYPKPYKQWNFNYQPQPVQDFSHQQ